MDKGLSLGIDLGGTKILAVLANSDMKPLAEAKSSTRIVPDPAMIAEQIKETGFEVLRGINASIDDVSVIGVAVPSSVDPRTGDCVHSPNLGLKNYSLKKHLEKFFGRDVYLANDGNCGVLAEFHAGAARGFNSVVAYFVGTGLGGGIIIDGKLLVGNGGIAGELGHTIVKYGGRKCNCGNKGCLEAYCSKAGFVKAIQRNIDGKGLKCSVGKFIKNGNIKSRYLALAYENLDPAVCRAVNNGIKMLGAAAASHVSTVAPECIILGGGVVEAIGDEFMEIFIESFKEHLFGIKPSEIAVRRASLGDSAVAIGATILAAKKGKI
ncbi:MAG: hypothetical protein A2017_04535 [Lentisphaerae bacterium GWF2_44_16]|nr:MAG: hypothetical protein A2017_04535 [Lentisphaerae bacterium GWF2_44_16]